MIVVHSVELSTLYQYIVISSPTKRLENLLFAILYTSFGVWFRDHCMLLQRFTIRVCRALLQFPPQASLAVLRFPPRRPLLHHVGWTNHHASSHSSEQGTQHIVLLISRQVIPYRTRDGTCCPGLPTPKIRYKLL
jgi:hypothetical protein